MTTTDATLDYWVWHADETDDALELDRRDARREDQIAAYECKRALGGCGLQSDDWDEYVAHSRKWHHVYPTVKP